MWHVKELKAWSYRMELRLNKMMVALLSLTHSHPTQKLKCQPTVPHTNSVLGHTDNLAGLCWGQP